MSLRVVAAGECMLELARDGGNWRLGAAGDSFNAALYMCRLGAEVRYLTALGIDPFSEEMLEGWSEEGLDLSLVVRDPERLPGLYAIRTSSSGERSFFYWRQHAAVRRLFELPGIEPVLRAATDCDLLLLTGITLSLFGVSQQQRWVELAARVRAGGGKAAFDPNYRPRGWSSRKDAIDAFAAIAPLADFLLATDEDDRVLWGTASIEASIAHWRRLGAAEVIVKQGAKGAAVGGACPTVQVDVPEAVTPIDTTGAGDSFNAAYLCARMSGADPTAAALAGHRLAGRVVQHPGAILPRA
jgi:2-dehydro-3-deoxygluconokinase